MRVVTSSDLRTAFTDYFVRKGHTFVKSSPLIPPGDPTLLFTNAGMVQFKGVFVGEEKRGYSRAVSCQKCLRVGGKHNDLERVGQTARHHTFFEMLGNFSFGDYFKEEAIELGWEFLTEAVGLSAHPLWVTVFRDDEEAYRLWREKIGIPASRIVRLGEADNFWRMGETGPCGPCSEIIIDQGEGTGCGKPSCGVGCDCDRYLELWNLVFMQYDQGSDGTLRPLPRPSIDTGLGLERLAAVCQGATTNYESDLFQPLLRAIGEVSIGSARENKKSATSMRVIADHLRAITFLVAEGVLPSNEGRGYVLRRVIRRAARHGRLIGLEEPFLYTLVNVVVDRMKGPYPELVPARTTITAVTLGEEERFARTLDHGLGLLMDLIEETQAAGKTVLPGAEIFKLYDTYGFPLDLAAEIAQEHRMVLDEAGFQAAMEEQRKKARWVVDKVDPEYEKLGSEFATTFVGYETLETQVTLKAILCNGKRVQKATEGDEVRLVFDPTPFYGESGGQVGDRGVLLSPEGKVEIIDALRPLPDLIVHQGKVVEGTVRAMDTGAAMVDGQIRRDTMRNHTATHILHAVLREVLGDHVKQSGSLVAPDRLRFDFTHFSSLTERELDRIEELVNERIRANDPVAKSVMGKEEALRRGALAFFGEKYGEKVRVVEISQWSAELCGGTHCHATGEIGLFKIVRETSVAAGMRRIEAVTGRGAYQYVKRQEETLREIAGLFKSPLPEVMPKVKKLLSMQKEQEKEIERLKVRAEHATEEPEVARRTIAGVKVMTKTVASCSQAALRAHADWIKVRESPAIIAVGTASEGKASLVVMVSKELSERFPALSLIKEIAPFIEGSGGGRAEMAQAGGKDPSRLEKALEKVFAVVERMAHEDTGRKDT